MDETDDLTICDRISLNGIRINCIVGVNSLEKLAKQELLINIDLFISAKDINKAASSDNIKDTIDYVEVLSLLKSTIEHNKYNLIETIAQQIAAVLLEKYCLLKKVIVTVNKKPNDLFQQLNYVSVQISMLRDH
jgi:FolB domain-containing protein